MQTANDIRTAFLEYFSKHDHEVVASGPLVPHNDPTLLFTNAGMVQFKNAFTGAESRDYQRAATSQKCVRAGGKHNDLDNVGYTARHHTFFEMLGNFSFGDYFKDRAIELAWNLVTDEFGLDAERLLVTVYHEDDQAYDLWKKIAGLADDRIIRIATSDNFWAMGDTGPCGPCSEIFYDHGDHIPGGPPGSPDEDGDRFIEIWNLVFMQFEQLGPDERIELPRPSIDTGMGLERIAAVMQGVHDNYDIDLMRHIMEATADISGFAIGGAQGNAHRVIADHLRATSFLLADGVMPSNEGRGYVLRRIMRRAMRHAHMMGCKDPLMWQLVPALISQMGQAFPELVRAEALITETLKLEETRFKQTLDRGLRLLDEASEDLDQGADLPGDVAFKLYDTYGFPFDLTEDVLRGRGLGVDRSGFDAAMERQRAEARAAWSGSGDAATEQVWFDIREDNGATEFLGYEIEIAEAQAIALVVDGARVDQAGPGTDVALVVNQTPFYGESGGQAGDSGVVTSAGGARLTVDNTEKHLGDLHVHMGTVTEGELRLGDVVELAVDGSRRTLLRANHSATHLLHEALRRRLGDHVTQKGSLVAADRLRFDFSQPRPLSGDDLAAVEADVNAQVRGNTVVTTTIMSPDEAVEHGAMALFGENYGDEVRVLAMGHDSAENRPYSLELCGGTHARRTGDIGAFKITSEGAVAAGIRRIEALTGAAALDYLNERAQIVAHAAAALKANPAELGARIDALVEQRKTLERDLAEARRKLVTGAQSSGGDDGLRDAGGVKLSARLLEGTAPKDLRGLADDLKKQLGSGVVALIAVNEGKAALVVAVTDDLTERFSAVDLVRAGAEVLGGKGGGGRPDMAQAGGPDGAKADDAFDAIETAISG
jgi:alanyl-tRNA synthetase